MKRFIRYGSIVQYRNVVKDVKHSTYCVGYDEDKKEILFDRNIKLPVITVVGTEKIHGTNASVCYSNPDGFWVQSRKNIIDSHNNPEYVDGSDNAGCAFTAYENKEEWLSIINMLAKEHDIDLDKNIITIYYEWCGGNIQRYSAVSTLDKMAIIFRHFKVSPIEPQVDDAGQETFAEWVETCIVGRKGMNKNGEMVENLNFWVQDSKSGILNIMNFPIVSLEIDFNNPLLAQNKLIDLVAKMEINSPVGQALGVENNTGEGYVFTFTYKDILHKFKVKGEKHAKGSGKVTTLKPVDDVLEQAKIDFVNNVACTPSRLEQAWQECFGIDNEKDEPSRKATGAFLKFMINDTVKEESDIMATNKISLKDINSMIANVARTWFNAKLDREML